MLAELLERHNLRILHEIGLLYLRAIKVIQDISMNYDMALYLRMVISKSMVCDLVNSNMILLEPKKLGIQELHLSISINL